MWLSVDPMSDKYPSLSPYNYCAWNPMKIVDPDGQFPRMPYFMRVMTSRHVYSAVAYKIRHGGNLDVWESHSGCIFASVQSRNGGVDASGDPVVQAKMFRPKGYTSEAQIKATTDVFTNAEAWMDEPATNVEDIVIKAATNIVYSAINEPIELITGSSLAGSEANSNDLEEAFAGVASSKLGVLLKKGMGTIKTIGKTGLDKYNDYVHKMGNYKGKTKKQMGQLYQKNKELNRAIPTFEDLGTGVNGAASLKKEE